MTTVCWQHPCVDWVKCDTSGNCICRGTAWHGAVASSGWTSASPMQTPVIRYAEAWLSVRTYIILILFNILLFSRFLGMDGKSLKALILFLVVLF